MHYLKYKEIKNRGTPTFPVGYYHVNESHPQYAMPYHWHDELELICVLEGTFNVSINENAYAAMPGDFFIVNSGSLHGGVPHSCVYECLVFPGGLLPGKLFSSSFLDALDMQELTLGEYYPAAENEKLHRLMAELFGTAKATGAGQELSVIGLLNQMMGYLCAEGLYTPADKTDVSRHKNIYLLKNVLNYIENNFNHKIQLDTLAKLAGMSPNYFCRLFFEMTSRTPIDYVNYYRIERACYQLVNTDRSVTEISYACGFNDMSYFIKTFKKYKGKSPGRYLKDGV